MGTLILLRHGQSTWNMQNRFTGTVDADLSMQGELEARLAAQLLLPYKINIAYSSMMTRAVHTLDIILQENGWKIPVSRDSSLNERDYGDLQGLDKSETALHYGAERVLLWRRGYNSAPPNGESLKDVFNRVVPFFKLEVEKKLQGGQTILLVAHGNSLRALVKYLEDVTDDEIANVDLATCIPRVYVLTDALKIAAVTSLAPNNVNG